MCRNPLKKTNFYLEKSLGELLKGIGKSTLELVGTSEMYQSVLQLLSCKGYILQMVPEYSLLSVPFLPGEYRGKPQPSPGSERSQIPNSWGPH